MRSCREMGLRTVAVFSEADRTSRHVMYADEAYCIGAAESHESYLNIDRIIDVAVKCKADAVHPGYGFLSENAEFVRRCEAAGIIFIGPTADTMEAMGDKIAARQRMMAAGVPVVPGTAEPLKDADEALRICKEIGFPVMLKASMGGGGKGMRLIHSEDEVKEAYDSARSESMSSFGTTQCIWRNSWKSRIISNSKYLGMPMATWCISSTGSAPCNAATRKLWKKALRLSSRRNSAGRWARKP